MANVMRPARCAFSAITTARRLILTLVFVVAALPPSGSAQAPQQSAAAAQAPVTLTLRLAGSRRQFRPGETIPIELTFESAIRQRFVVDGATYDRSGRLTIDQFLIEPSGPVTDPLLDYFATYAGYIGGGIRTTGVLGEKPFVVTVDLNEWFRFETPGQYSLSARSNRVTDETARTETTRPVVPTDSNRVSFEILPRDTAWEAREIAGAIETIDAPQAGRGKDPRTACRALRFLATDAAVVEMARRYEDQRCQWDFMAGLFSATDRERVVRTMVAGLSAPEQPISRSYLRTLAQLSVYAQHPEFRAAQTPETKGRLLAGGAIGKQPELVEQAEAGYAAVLAAALAQKTAAARAISLAELQTVKGRAPTDSPAAAASLQRQVIAGFGDLPAERQTRMLEYEWHSVAHADMLPVLRRLADGSGRIADLALRRLYELAPDEGRARILREVRSPKPDASLATLGLLPDAELPDLDGVLAGNVERDVSDLHAGLLHRYASRAVAPRLLPRLGSRVATMACRPQSYVVAYFLRTAPSDGAVLLDRVLASRTGTGCYQFVLRDTAALHMTPAIEAAATTRLDDPHPRVVQNAIDTLGQYGSAAAVRPLRSHFERWHAEWQGRSETLRYNVLAGPDQPGAAQTLVESAYLRALGAGQGWLIRTAREIDELRALCVTESCRSEAQAIAGSAGSTTIQIYRFEDANDVMGRLAQYEIRSLDGLKQKLSQYERGTRFTLDLRGLDSQVAARLAADLRSLAAAQTLEIQP